MKHELLPLNYSYDALEPYIDAATMEVHYSKHHQKYLDNFNAVLEKHPELQELQPEELLKQLPTLQIDEADKKAIKNNGGGYVNHNFFWSILGPQKQLDNALIEEITKEFGSIDEFKKLFTLSAVGHFGSGWAWLVRDENGKLKVYSLPNQESPLSLGHTPLLTLDIWEHAYYLKYQNRRPEYVDNFWNVLKLI
ncbi:MAG TPA: superoxide dismutase [Candidatus Gracilibacteria bacterium]|nr:superoxide dismutase [Candidatus Gracilibacteria bacterium]